MTSTPTISPPIRRVMRDMEEHFAEPLSLAELAHMCNRSLYPSGGDAARGTLPLAADELVQ